ncbi:hypothetical protein [Nocardia sp. NPDC004750]
MIELPQIRFVTAKRAKATWRPSDHVAARPFGVAEFGGVPAGDTRGGTAER